MNYRQNLALLIAVSLICCALGQMLILSSVPHEQSARRTPHQIEQRLASVQERVETAVAVRISSLRART